MTQHAQERFGALLYYICFSSSKPCVRRFIPRGHIWLEGDNSRASYDSRHYGPVPIGLVQSRVFVKVYTCSNLPLLHHFKPGVSNNVHTLLAGLILRCTFVRLTKYVKMVSVILGAIKLVKGYSPTNRAGPSRCGAQCKTWARGPMQDLGVGPLWAAFLWRHRVRSTVLRSW